MTALMVGAVAALPLLMGCSSGSSSESWPGDRGTPVVISAGGVTGIYHAYGERLAEVLRARYDIRVQVLETGGSVENLNNLADGKAQVAFSAVDAAADAVAGRGPFTKPLQVRALARVYDDFIHLVVPADSDIASVDDLRGRVVSLGAEGSGTALIAERLLDVAGIKQSELDVRSLGIDQSIQALRAGEIDAFFWSGGLHTPGLDALAETFPIRLLPLDTLVDGVRSEYGSGYRHGVVPKGTYGLPEGVSTLAVPNLIVVRADMPDPVARALVATLFGARSEIAEEVPSAALLDRARAIFSSPVALHPGALQYYRDTKV